MRFFSDMLNNMFNKLDPNKIVRLLQRCIAHAGGAKSNGKEVTAALRSMTNARAVGPGELPVENLKHGFHDDAALLRELQRVITLVWHGGKVLQPWRETVLKLVLKKGDRTD